jgi:hypothetical protein
VLNRCQETPWKTLVQSKSGAPSAARGSESVIQSPNGFHPMISLARVRPHAWSPEHSFSTSPESPAKCENHTINQTIGRTTGRTWQARSRSTGTHASLVEFSLTGWIRCKLDPPVRLDDDGWCRAARDTIARSGGKRTCEDGLLRRDPKVPTMVSFPLALS